MYLAECGTQRNIRHFDQLYELLNFLEPGSVVQSAPVPRSLVDIPHVDIPLSSNVFETFGDNAKRGLRFTSNRFSGFYL